METFRVAFTDENTVGLQSDTGRYFEVIYSADTEGVILDFDVIELDEDEDPLEIQNVTARDTGDILYFLEDFVPGNMPSDDRWGEE
tara:strand:+ start:1122 stop:1379 length:258 start_codon:yes stop_codon:yes gene_type:complete